MDEQSVAYPYNGLKGTNYHAHDKMDLKTTMLG